MDQYRDPEDAAESAKNHLTAAVGDIREAASAKVEELRQAAEQRAEGLRDAAHAKAQKLKGDTECAWSDAKSQARTWQAEGEVYVRANPAKALFVALGAGFVLGLLFRK
jgi:ElaB/YqjD/DUF883 family membrane-anchored ribosome-binding protein